MDNKKPIIIITAVLLALTCSIVGVFDAWFIYQLLKIGLCVLALFGCIVHTLRRQGKRKCCTKSVSAYVEDIRSNGSRKYAPTYVFTVNDEQIRVHSDLYTLYSPSRGKCEILIDPNDPHRIFEPKREREDTIIFLAVAVAAVIGIYIVLRYYLFY